MSTHDDTAVPINNEVDRLVLIGDDLWVRCSVIDGVRIRWSEISVGAGSVEVFIGGEWLPTTGRSESRTFALDLFDNIAREARRGEDFGQ